MATTKSMKALCHLVCSAYSQVSQEILKQELVRNVDTLQKGILVYPTTGKPETTTSKKVGKLASFIQELSKVLGIEEINAKTVLQTYLSGNYYFVPITNEYVADF